MMNTQRCPNLNHRRSNAPVRGCPNCGGVVNAQIRAGKCSEAAHAAARKDGNYYCTACCEQLRKP